MKLKTKFSVPSERSGEDRWCDRKQTQTLLFGINWFLSSKTYSSWTVSEHQSYSQSFSTNDVGKAVNCKKQGQKTNWPFVHFECRVCDHPNSILCSILKVGCISCLDDQTFFMGHQGGMNCIEKIGFQQKFLRKNFDPKVTIWPFTIQQISYRVTNLTQKKYTTFSSKECWVLLNLVALETFHASLKAYNQWTTNFLQIASIERSENTLKREIDGNICWFIADFYSRAFMNDGQVQSVSKVFQSRKTPCVLSYVIFGSESGLFFLKF